MWRLRDLGVGAGLLGMLTTLVVFAVVQLGTTASTAAAASAGIVTGPGPGGGPDVELFNGVGFPPPHAGPGFFAYNTAFNGGVRVAAGDFTGDGVDDIVTGPGPGGGPNVNIYSGVDNSLVSSFFAFDPGFTAGIFVAAADVNGDGKADLIVGAGPGGSPEVKVYNGAGPSLLYDFTAFDPGYTGGVTVAAGDYNADGTADIITGSAISDSVVNVWSGKGGTPNSPLLLKNFRTYDGWQGGIFVGAGDINGDGKADVITGVGPGGGPHVKVFSGGDGSLLYSFFAYDGGFHGGVRVAATDANNDGQDDVVVGPGAGGGPNVKVFSGNGGATLSSFFAYNQAFGGGVYPSGHLTGGTVKVNSATPPSAGQGTTNKDIVINGSGFLSGSTVTFSGAGITINKTTVTDGNHITVNISIDSAAAKTARDITVTRTDAKTSTCTGCFTVTGKPTVTSVTVGGVPASGFTGSTVNNININGSDFVNGAVVSFSGTGLLPSTATFNSSSQVTINLNITEGAAPGARDVTVTNPDGGAGTLAGGFTVKDGPHVTSASPTSITPPASGTSSPTDVVITGTGFVTGPTNANDGSQVTFSGSGITVTKSTFNSATSVTATITVDSGAPHGVRTITVTNPSNGGAGSCATCFNIGPEPTIASVTPNQRGQGAPGATPPCPSSGTQPPGCITIKGNNFRSDSVVSFPAGSTSITNPGVTVNGAPVNPDPNTLIVSVTVASNATPGLRDVVVTNSATPAGAVNCGGCFTVTAKPTVSGSSPSSAGQGAKMTVTVNGTGFQNPANVDFGAGITVTSGSIVVNSPSQITAEITVDSAATIGARDITVVNLDGGVGVCSGCFTVTAKPIVSSLAPNSRAQGSAPVDVVITGDKFVSGATVAFSGTGITFTSVTFTDAQHLTVKGVTVASSAPATARDVTVTNPDKGAGTKTGGFTVTAGPQITSVVPSSLNQGATSNVDFNGTGFQSAPPPGATLTFSPPDGITVNGSLTTTATKITANLTISATAPQTQRTVTVTNPDGGVGTCVKCFSIGPLPTVASVNPSSTGQGTTKNVTVKGTNFVTGATATTGSQASFAPATGITVNSTTFVDESTLTVNLTVAGNAPTGAKDVTVTNPAAGAHPGTSAPCTGCFAVNAAPTISTVNPATLKKGDTAKDVVITGTNYQSGATSGFGAGITVNSTTFTDASHLKANVTVDSTAAIGARDVTVLNPDGGAVTCSGCFGVTA